MNKKRKEKKHRNKPYPDRIYRGRILKLIRENKKITFGPIGLKVDPNFDPKQDNEWLREILKRMERDKFIVKNRKGLFALVE
jgi:hypothetical protein